MSEKPTPRPGKPTAEAIAKAAKPPTLPPPVARQTPTGRPHNWDTVSPPGLPTGEVRRSERSPRAEELASLAGEARLWRIDPPLEGSINADLESFRSDGQSLLIKVDAENNGDFIIDFPRPHGFGVEQTRIPRGTVAHVKDIAVSHRGSPGKADVDALIYWGGNSSLGGPEPVEELRALAKEVNAVVLVCRRVDGVRSMEFTDDWSPEGEPEAVTAQPARERDPYWLRKTRTNFAATDATAEWVTGGDGERLHIVYNVSDDGSYRLEGHDETPSGLNPIRVNLGDGIVLELKYIPFRR
jgi:hypothetical protein